MNKNTNKDSNEEENISARNYVTKTNVCKPGKLAQVAYFIFYCFVAYEISSQKYNLRKSQIMRV